MKGPLDRTKVVLRHLPPTISQSNLVQHIDYRFSGRYCWLVFCPGKFSPKHLKYARAYIDFNKPEDVIEFAEFCNGHVFVNEKGTQFRTIVEYAPFQRVPKQWERKDGREGNILKDPEYLEFLEFLAKPVENLPSAEIQLERKEAERASAPKDVPIVTPLMDYVRQKRAIKGGALKTVFNGKPARRVSGASSKNPVSGSSKRGLEKRTPSTMHILRDSSKVWGTKNKSTYSPSPKQDDQQLSHKSVNSTAKLRNEILEGESGSTRSVGVGKKKILLLKGKEKEIPNVFGSQLLQQNTATPNKASHGSAPPKQNQQRESSGRIIRSILLNRDTRQNQPSLGSQSELHVQSSNQERDKKAHRPPIVPSFQKDINGALYDKVVCNDLNAVPTEKQERRMRNKDRPDCGVWTPLRHSDGSHSSDESLSSSTTQTFRVVDAVGGTHLEMKQDVVACGGERRPIGSGRGRHYFTDNGSFRHGGRRGSSYHVKDGDGSSVVEGKFSKRGVSSGYGSHEKQVWVQRSSSAT